METISRDEESVTGAIGPVDPVEISEEVVQDENKIVTLAEEAALFESLHNGDPEAEEKIMNRYDWVVGDVLQYFLPFVYESRRELAEDLTQVGRIGLFNAMREYDPTLGSKFSTYAWTVVKSRMINEFGQVRNIKIPPEVLKLSNKMNQFLDTRKYLYNQAEGEFSREYLTRRLSSELEVSSSTISTMIEARKLLNMISLEEKDEITSQNDPSEMFEVEKKDNIPDLSENTEARLLHEDEIDQLFKLLDQLDSKQQAVVVMRFGLNGNMALNTTQIAETLGLTTEQVRELEHSAMRTLRQMARSL